MALLQFYAHLSFRAAALLMAGLALACLAVLTVLGGALPDVELNGLVARAATALHRDACRLRAAARGRKAPELPVSRSGDAG